MIYIAFVSHDDESEFTPIGWAYTGKDAVELCVNHSKQNDDRVHDWLWETWEHTRIPGGFANCTVKNESGHEFTYYVRPLDIDRAVSHIPPGPGGKGGL